MSLENEYFCCWGLENDIYVEGEKFKKSFKKAIEVSHKNCRGVLKNGQKGEKMYSDSLSFT